ncbi:succinyldiaminopimelate transaminase [Rarobacter incanus]|uniref:Aminotransferase n=1 Tax=Rarobacter incanus TaxID=153494 RepID=A0A542SNA9_9MICO|nr:succinyldiaminopimelate transaminase [Rarobacter incanus]TQK76116.1 succinyldiaminopimelate aminotransferase [Rarobacter incanus]
MGFESFTEDYPWDQMASYRQIAAGHPGGAIDLSIGTPVDDTPQVVQEALREAANAPGYPLTVGTAALRQAVVDWFGRRRGATGLGAEQVLPTIGSKELVGLLPSLLGLGAGDTVVFPEVAYPTYRVGALLAGAHPLATNEIGDWEADPSVRLVWINSPGNPTGSVLSVAHLRRVVQAARKRGAVVVSDECYAELNWCDVGTTTPSILDDAVCDGDRTGLLAAYSLSKQSNIAGYRAAFVAGDSRVIGDLVRLRRHLGMIVPAPVQHAMTVALGDDDHVRVQRATYKRRRDLLVSACAEADLEICDSQAGLYLWVRDGRSRLDGWGLIEALARAGIVAGPGAFYGEGGRRNVRISLTATDGQIAAAAQRIAALRKR